MGLESPFPVAEGVDGVWEERTRVREPPWPSKTYSKGEGIFSARKN